jgi:hypothetical protein
MPKIINQTTDYDYKVTTRPLYDLNPEQVALLQENENEATFAGVYGNFRNEVDSALGIVTERYALVQNSDVVGNIEESLDRRGLLGMVEKEFNVVDYGKRFYARYSIKNPKSEFNFSPAKGDNVGVSFTFQNSFDCTKRLNVALGFLRLVCTNGMTSLSKQYEVNFRHQTGIDVGAIGDGIDAALDSMTDQTKVFQRLANTGIDHEKGLNILENLTKKKVISGAVRDNIAAIWNAQAQDETIHDGLDKDRNLWNLYNAATQHITRVIEPKRFEQASRLSGSILNVFDRAARTKKFLTDVTTELKVENN